MSRKVLLTDEEQRNELIAQLDNELAERRDYVLQRASELLDYNVTVSSLHGKIGGKNNTFADCVNSKFINFQDFYSTWLKEFNNRCERDKVKLYEEGSLSDLLTLFSDKDVREYTELFLERNFIKNYRARVRNKPEESMWKIWFGNEVVFGLFIAPATGPDGSIRIDKSEIRRTDYNYWTIGHIMYTGLYNPEDSTFYKFSDVDDFIAFYKNILKQLSKSPYEKKVYARYIDYLHNSKDILTEPFLIPEFRYEGREKKCKYRVDFTVLNPHTFKFVGFELSPSSTHMSISGIKGKKQVEVNEELKDRWEKEMHKRNEYLERYGVALVTFTDSDLQDIDRCFASIGSVLRERGEQANDIKNEERRLERLIADG